MSLPSPSYLHARLRYEPGTGKLFWRYYEPHGPRWNGKWAGREAFTADNGEGYRAGLIDRQSFKAHRVIWAMVTGRWVKELDHKDHDRANNRIRNLRSVTRAANKQNLPVSRVNTSGVVGVHWREDIGKWRANIGVGDRRTLYLGCFDDFDDAVAARKAAEIEHGFHPNHGATK